LAFASNATATIANAVWRDFWDFPPKMRLSEPCAKLKCDTCGSVRGFPVDVWPIEVGVHHLNKSNSMARHREQVSDQDLASFIPANFALPLSAGWWGVWME